MTGFIIFVVLMIIFGFGRKAAKRQTDRTTPSPTVEKLLERIRAQQGANQPHLQGQYTQPAQGQFPVPGQHPAPTQVPYPAPGQAQYPVPGQYPAPGQAQYPAPGQWQYPAAPAPAPQQQWQPQYQQRADRTQHGRQPEHNFPAPNSPLERRIRELMSTGQEVPAIRLLCDEQDLGIIEAQEYARGLVAPASKADSHSTDPDQTNDEPAEEETQYVGSAAFAESVFDLDREENAWASGWVEKPEPEDRTDMDELWQTVRNSGRPTP